MSHGGARAGAGRPRKANPRVGLSTTISEATRASLRELWDDYRISQGAVFDELIRTYGQELRETLATRRQQRSEMLRRQHDLFVARITGRLPS